jgi:hypothetical protein
VARACGSDENSVSFGHSSLSRLMKLSTKAFGCGFSLRGLLAAFLSGIG